MLMKRSRRLKITAQLAAVFPADPELSIPTQELFEQFFEAHGLPNDAESDLLQAVGHVEAETIDTWCEFHSNYRMCDS